jgi:carboxypeptidase family protein
MTRDGTRGLGRGIAAARAIGRTIASSLALAALAAASLGAQVVRGTIVERGSGAPVAGVVIAIVDARGIAVSTTLSDEHGDFEVRVAGAGTYAVDAKRIGVRRVRGPRFTIGVGETHREAIAVDAISAALAAVRVVEKNECVRRPGDDVRTAALWEDARAALTATNVTRRRAATRATVIRYIRQLSPIDDRVIADTREERTGPIERPFVSAPAPELSRAGYVRENRDGTTDYFGPDADVLLSDEFLADHCFRIERREVEGGEEVGLAFEPLPRRKVADVRGVLWVSRRTAELRAVEFRFTRLPFEEGLGEFGGEVGFARLPSGEWIVQRWQLRMPVYRRDPGQPTRLDGRTVTRGLDQIAVDRVQVEGGEVLLPGAAPSTGGVAGIVIDSIAAGPAAGVVVAADGTTHVARTDADGRFALEGVAPGTYTLSMHRPSFDSLGVVLPPVRVQVSAGRTVPARLALPSRRALAERLCVDSVDFEAASIVRVVVVDSVTGVPLRQAPFDMTWSLGVRRGGSTSLRLETQTTQHVLDAGGGYLICGAPGGRTVSLESPAGAAAPWRASLVVPYGEITWRVVRARRR